MPANAEGAGADGGWFEVELRRDLDVLRRAGLYRRLRTVERQKGMRVVVDGKAYHDFSSNDYLDLATDPRVAEAIAEAASRHGAGAAASRSIAGNHPLHEALEHDLARHVGTEAALLFPSGVMANLGTIPALVGRRDVIYSDELNHASILDGCRLSRATVRSFPHGDLDALAMFLAEDRGRYRRRLIAVEGVYSMDGDRFPLDRLAPLARRFDAAIYLDDAHGTGVVGPDGAGSAAFYGVTSDMSVHMGTLGKALGVAGAFVAGSRVLREFLLNRARSFIFTTGSPPALAAGAAVALGIARREESRRARLHRNAARLHSALAGRGRAPLPATPGHIIPIVLGGAERARRVGELLFEHGILVGVGRPPSVPIGKARLRITVSAGHSPTQVDLLAEALREVL